MTSYYFRNPSLLPLIAATTLGVSDKSSEDPIGRFGTGLKYTIAGALRLNQEFSIVIGGHGYYFFAKPEKARDKFFNIVWMEDMANGEQTRLGYSTELGKHWEPWMYIRELYSNCKDEGGTHGWFDKDETPKPGSDETFILISGEIFESALKSMDDFILSKPPAKILSQISLHEKPVTRKPKIFLKNILVGEFMKDFEFDVNLLIDTRLSEDRTVISVEGIGDLLATNITASEELQMVEAWATNKDSNHLATSHRGWIDIDTPAFKLIESIWRESPFRLNESWRNYSAWRFDADHDATKFELSPLELHKFNKALAFIKKLGFDQTVVWNFVDPKDNEAFGFVSGGKIYICRKAFEQGTTFLAQTMIEEYIHAVKKTDDYTRAFQDTLLSRLVAVGEELHGSL
jgi:hypothetical protein